MVKIPMPPPHGRADLHMHTTASDGTLPPAKQVAWAKEQGLAAIAITDHDTVRGWDEALTAGAELGIEIVPGCELSTEVEKAEVHILGYYFDREEPRMKELLERMRGGRRARAAETVAKLHALGHTQVSLEAILAAGGESVGRPHIAQALVDAGIVRTKQDAFERFLTFGKPAYVPRPKLTPAEAIEIIHGAGGVAVLAHPGLVKNDNIVRAILGQGIDGIEAYHSDHGDGQRQFYARWGLDLGLIVTGGTDSHGPNGMRTVVPGSVNVGLEVIAQLKERAAYVSRQNQA
jgi:predicted metal-dependent phosphoesterase TrpH